MNTSPTTITHLASNEGPGLSVAGSRYRILVSGAQTDRRYAVIEMVVPPGSGPVPHDHPGIEENLTEGLASWRR